MPLEEKKQKGTKCIPFLKYQLLHVKGKCGGMTLNQKCLINMVTKLHEQKIFEKSRLLQFKKRKCGKKKGMFHGSNLAHLLITVLNSGFIYLSIFFLLSMPYCYKITRPKWLSLFNPFTSRSYLQPECRRSGTYSSSETPQCQQKTGWAFFLWLFLLFLLTDTARTTPPPGDLATLLPLLALILTVCGLGSASETMPGICKGFHLQRKQALHLSCTPRVLILILHS